MLSREPPSTPAGCQAAAQRVGCSTTGGFSSIPILRQTHLCRLNCMWKKTTAPFSTMMLCTFFSSTCPKKEELHKIYCSILSWISFFFLLLHYAKTFHLPFSMNPKKKKYITFPSASTNFCWFPQWQLGKWRQSIEAAGYWVIIQLLH